MSGGRPGAVVLGVGNPFRRDDGVGAAVVAALEPAGLPRGTTVAALDGEPARLLDAWTGADLAVVVDAVRRTPARPGRIERSLLEDRGSAHRSTSSHGLGVPDAVALGRALDRLPRRLVLYAVEAGDLGTGPGLSPAVRAAVPEVVRRVRSELRQHGRDRR